MGETPDPENSAPEDAKEAPSVKSVLSKANETLETANTTAQNAGNVLNTIKWVAIAIVTLVFFFIGVKIYQIIAAPAAMVGDAVDGVSDAVKSSSEAVAEGTSSVINRLDIPTTDQRRLNRLSENAFTALSTMPAKEPEGIKERMFWSSNLGGHDGRVCEMELDFGNGAIPVFAAADNEAYATARALGSKDDRLMRFLIETGDEDVAINAVWDEDNQLWQMKWKRTTLSKPVSDSVAQARMFDVLGHVSKRCQ